jgi:hypothetical protein
MKKMDKINYKRQTGADFKYNKEKVILNPIALI